MDTAADAAADVAVDVAEDEETDTAADAAVDVVAEMAEDKETDATAVSAGGFNQHHSRGMTIGTTAGHVGMMFRSGTTSKRATINTRGIRRVQQNTIRWAAAPVKTTRRSFPARRRICASCNNSNNNKELTSQRQQWLR